MREITVKRGSYSWRFATVYGPLDNWRFEETDICTYWDAVFRGFIMWVLYISIAALCAAFLGDFLAWAATGFAVGIRDTNIGAQVVTMILACSAALIIVVGLMGVCYNISQRSSSTFISDAYQSWRDKFCVKIKVQ